MNEKLTVGSCFSGIGGLELGLEWTGGFETRWQIENDEYASKVLAKHWPNVKRYSDIRDVVQPERVDVICGGFPCQDVSLAGARKGLEGKRSTLWGELFRLVCEVRPQWLLAENVPGLLSANDGRFFGNILRDLAGAGYDAEWGVLSAAGVGAPHLRKRVFILSYPAGFGLGEVFVQDRESQKDGRIPRKYRGSMCEKVWGIPNSEICRNLDGFPNGLHRFRCAGNAVVPQVAQKIGEMILNHVRTPEPKGE